MIPLEIAPVADAGLLPACTPSSMPFHISYTGLAPISRYFRPRPAPPSFVASSMLPSGSATLVASSSSTSITSQPQSSLTTQSSTTFVASLAHESERRLGELSLKTGPSVVEPVENTRLLGDGVMGIASETQPVLGAIEQLNYDDSFRSVHARTSASRNVGRLVAAFRGRQMYGQAVDIPDGYGGLVLRAPVDSKAGEEGVMASSKLLSQKAKPKLRTRAATRRLKHVTMDDGVHEREGRDDGDCRLDSDDNLLPQAKRLIPSSTFTSFTLWTPDRPLDEGKDEYARALLEWINLASEIHTYDE